MRTLITLTLSLSIVIFTLTSLKSISSEDNINSISVSHSKERVNSIDKDKNESIAVISLSGVNTGKNLFISNPKNLVNEFAIKEITIISSIGVLKVQNIGSSIINIDFEELGLKTGDQIYLDIRHSSGVRPKLINPEELKLRSPNSKPY